MPEMLRCARRFFTPEGKLYEQEAARWVKIHGGRTLEERIAGYRLKEKDLTRDLKDLGARVKPLYSGRAGIIIRSEILMGKSFYSLATVELRFSRRPPFLEIKNTDLVSVSLGMIPSLREDPDLLPANSWSGAIERDHTTYIQCELYERSISGWVRNTVGKFADEHGYPTERVFFNERFKNSPESTQEPS
ncbi:MAG: hypothetical protein HYY87_01940 [Candidatus Levybacteria bacterium]|nr:hypothetical protein [Candidatus Levybacteria bacterium]MBI2190021.1 hypothetical protein [Candidatus Levybacteria bacterium]MBI2622913.1 hypothetical protein [Candidatus Levybacteria bacterium]MBI3070046.1 hypothetical protein [Candidatus Levybacteria bacterium]